MSSQSSPQRHKILGLPQSHLGHCHAEENNPGAELLCLGLRNKWNVSKLLLKISTQVKIRHECGQIEA